MRVELPRRQPGAVFVLEEWQIHVQSSGSPARFQGSWWDDLPFPDKTGLFNSYRNRRTPGREMCEASAICRGSRGATELDRVLADVVLHKAAALQKGSFCRNPHNAHQCVLPVFLIQRRPHHHSYMLCPLSFPLWRRAAQNRNHAATVQQPGATKTTTTMSHKNKMRATLPRFQNLGQNCYSTSSRAQLLLYELYLMLRNIC